MSEPVTKHDLNRSLAELRKDMNRQFGVLLEHMDQKFAIVGEGFEAIFARFDHNDRRFDAIEKKLDDMAPLSQHYRLERRVEQLEQSSE